MSANQYTVPDKATGDTWTAAEHNMLKAVHNLVAVQVCNAETAIATLQTQVPTPAQIAQITQNASDIAALQTDQSSQDAAIAQNAANFSQSLDASPEW